MVVTDLQPSSVVEDSGFGRLVSVLDPRYELPSRRTVMRNHLPSKYETIKQQLLQDLAVTTSVGLTTDIWTSRQTESFCCVTAHYIINDWELQSSVLETFQLTDSHTADNIAESLKKVVQNWGIENKVITLFSIPQFC